MTTFQCPDCRRIHAEPTAATFALLVQCEDCALADAHALARDTSQLLRAA